MFPLIFGMAGRIFTFFKFALISINPKELMIAARATCKLACRPKALQAELRVCAFFELALILISLRSDR